MESIGLVFFFYIIDLSGNNLLLFEDGIKFNDLEVFFFVGNKNFIYSFDFLLDVMELIRKFFCIFNISECNFYGIIIFKLWKFENLIFVDLRKNNLIGMFLWVF